MEWIIFLAGIFSILWALFYKKEKLVETRNEIDLTNYIPKEVFNKYVDESRLNVDNYKASNTLLNTQLEEYKLALETTLEKYNTEISKKKSEQVRLGAISENLVPFLKEFRYDPKACHFLGMPVDYVFFGEDELVFIEVKTGNSQLSSKQKNIKKLIENKKVRFEVHRLDGGTYEIKE